MNTSQILAIITAYNNDTRSFTDKDAELIKKRNLINICLNNKLKNYLNLKL